MVSARTPTLDPQTTDTDTPMHEEAPDLNLKSLGLQDTYSLDFKKLKELRKQVGAPKWVRAAIKLLQCWGTHQGLFGKHAHDLWELVLRVDKLGKKHLNIGLGFSFFLPFLMGRGRIGVRGFWCFPYQTSCHQKRMRCYRANFGNFKAN